MVSNVKLLYKFLTRKLNPRKISFCNNGNRFYIILNDDILAGTLMIDLSPRFFVKLPLRTTYN